MIVQCKRCGKDMSDQDEKCPSCGATYFISYAASEKATTGHVATKDIWDAHKKKIIIGIVAAVVVIGVIVSFVNEKNAEKRREEYYNSLPTYNEQDFAILYLKISDVEIEHNSSYTVATGTVTNTGTTTYDFVKVRGAFVDSSGVTVDTDWTYAAGQEGIAPGESTSFYMSVPKDTSITRCNVTLMD